VTEMGHKIPIDRMGRIVAQNVTDIVAVTGYTELSRMLYANRRDIAVLGVRNITQMRRRVDVDDLAAIAACVGLEPAELLKPDVVNRCGERVIRALLDWRSE